jgi:glycolate oxidase FAD binding subunit
LIRSLYITNNLATTATTIEALSPANQAEVAEGVRGAYEANQAVHIVGGGTAQDYGNAPTLAGQTLDLSGVAKVVDYTPRDMTIVVEAGVRMADLAATLAAEGQRLPIDVPRAGDATIGGVVATNWNGPRRFGHGTIRDYVIGINAVDGRGTPFKGGGRVVKNVAGYDFCKLLTGSLGTLAVVTQLALKVKPQSESAAAVVGECADLTIVESALSRIAMLETPPVAIDLLIGEGWTAESPIRNQVVVRLEGTEQETTWLAEQVERTFAAAGCTAARVLSKLQSESLWSRQIEFSDRGLAEADDSSPMVLKIAVPPSAVTEMIRGLLAVDANCAIQAHAGNGIVIARFREFRHEHISKSLVAKLRPAAVRLGGSLVTVRSKLEGLTPHLVWGGRTDATVLLEQIKRQFDPRGVLNPGRFVF